MTRTVACSLVIATALGLATTTATTASAAPPGRERGSFVETFDDDFIFDLCGIRTQTTETQRWSSTVRADGSEVVRVVRTFVSDDPRLPVEKGAGTTFIAPDGTRRVVGKPVQLIGPDGGVRLLDAGRIDFDPAGNTSDVRGPHPSLDADLRDYYRPQ
ncbi:hypothetical protein [Blastococcus sp. CT_GayMR16]|uniref:hypothetical protein n=1 Tax=Blastococcus sp. CT_GayMR16 TaxID=2559607 RepID=UPI00107462C5|nr:hypothetical protein [Blastococcus sp. CT_GayMR16]TFV88549.1 hypothetical protein E4P38_10280 [Blastococcus sp. CT_GayMR16]